MQNVVDLGTWYTYTDYLVPIVDIVFGKAC